MRYGPTTRRRHAVQSPNVGSKGTGYAADQVERIVQVRHVVGFTREDWGEGNWTARDMR